MLEEKHEIYIAAVRVCCTCKVFFCLREKKCAARAKFVFLLIRSVVVVLWYHSRCFHLVFSITGFYIFFEETINIKESFAFFRG